MSTRQATKPTAVQFFVSHARWRKRFLDELLLTGSVKKAAASAGIVPSQAYIAKRHDEAFREDWRKVMEIVDDWRADQIEEATAQRAIEGTPYTKFSPKDGKVVEQGTDPDTPAAFGMLKSYRPERFREQKAPEAGPGEFINSVTSLVRALEDRKRPQPTLSPARPELPALEAEVVRETSPDSPPPLIQTRGGVN